MRVILLAVFLTATCAVCLGQDKAITPVAATGASLTTTAPAIELVAPAPVPADPFLAMRIPPNSKIYIAPFKTEDSNKPVEGFETHMAAAIRKKVIMVADRSQADFEILGSADKKGPGFAKKWLLGDFRNSTSASLSVTTAHGRCRLCRRLGSRLSGQRLALIRRKTGEVPEDQDYGRRKKVRQTERDSSRQIGES
jgi:hypothetical protein